MNDRKICYPLFDYLNEMGIVESRKRKSSGDDNEGTDEVRVTELGKCLIKSLCASTGSVASQGQGTALT